MKTIVLKCLFVCAYSFFIFILGGITKNFFDTHKLKKINCNTIRNTMRPTEINFNDVNIKPLVAISDNQKKCGYKDYNYLNTKSGILFQYSEIKKGCFTMKNTPLSLFILFINSDLKIKSIIFAKKHYPDLICPGHEYQYVLELPLNIFYKTKPQINTQLKITMTQ